MSSQGRILNCSWKELLFQTFFFLYFLGLDSWEIDYNPPTSPPKKVLPEAVMSKISPQMFK